MLQCPLFRSCDRYCICFLLFSFVCHLIVSSTKGGTMPKAWHLSFARTWIFTERMKEGNCVLSTQPNSTTQYTVQCEPRVACIKMLLMWCVLFWIPLDKLTTSFFQVNLQNFTIQNTRICTFVYPTLCSPWWLLKGKSHFGQCQFQLWLWKL